MVKTKYLLYSFKVKDGKKFTYWYETDKKFFRSVKPSTNILNQIVEEKDSIEKNSIIKNPWIEWSSNDIQKIISKNGISINYLKTTNQSLIELNEDKKLLEVYSYLVENFDISKSFDFQTVKQWHKMIFENIYPFAGDLRTVEMSKGLGIESWTWRLTFLNAIPDLNSLIKRVSFKQYDDLDLISEDLSMLICDFLFIHPFREGNGRISRLLCDILLAKNGFPMIGLDLKRGDNYIERIHAGYNCNYKPMMELLKNKIEEGIKNG